jgi:hypothetical protein
MRRGNAGIEERGTVSARTNNGTTECEYDYEYE